MENVTASDAKQSLLAGAVDVLAEGAADTMNLVANVILSAGVDSGAKANVRWRPMEPKSSYFGREGGAIANGILAVEGGRGLGKSVGDAVDTRLLQQHMKNAVARFNAEGYTAKQAASLVDNPGLAGAHRGTQIDTFFKEALSLDPRLSHLELTPRFSFGPDVVDTANQRWWDVTTPGQWDSHLQKYTLFGEGTPLFTQ